MLNIGNYNTLRIIKILSFGAYLDGGNGKEILLPTRYVPDGAKVGDEVKVFIYHDNEGRLIATTLRPKAVVGEFAFMRVKSVSSVCPFRSRDGTHHGIDPHREVFEQCSAQV